MIFEILQEIKIRFFQAVWIASFVPKVKRNENPYSIVTRFPTLPLAWFDGLEQRNSSTNTSSANDSLIVGKKGSLKVAFFMDCKEHTIVIHF